MIRRNAPDSEYRLMLLAVLDRLGPATEDQLLRFLTEAELMGYIDMRLNLVTLVNQGQVSTLPHYSGELYTITAQGREALSAFAARVPHQTQQLLDRDGDTWRAEFITEQQTLAEAYALADGRKAFHFRLLDGESALLDAVLITNMDSLPGFIRERWQKAAQQVYAAVLAELSRGYDSQQTALADSGHEEAIQRLDSGELMVTLDDGQSEPTLVLMLSVPDMGLAHWMVSQWHTHIDAIRAMLMDIIT